MHRGRRRPLAPLRRAADRCALRRSCPLSNPSLEVIGFKDSPDRLRQLSFSGHDLVKLRPVPVMHALTRSASLTNYESVARSVGLDPFRMLRMAKLPARVL